MIIPEIHWELAKGDEFVGETSGRIGEGSGWDVAGFGEQRREHMLYDSGGRVSESQVLEASRRRGKYVILHAKSATY